MQNSLRTYKSINRLVRLALVLSCFVTLHIGVYAQAVIGENVTTTSPVINDKFKLGSTFGLGLRKNTGQCGPSFQEVWTFRPALVNRSSHTISEIIVKIIALTNGNLLLNADGGLGSAGTTLTVPPELLDMTGKSASDKHRNEDYLDGVISPGEEFVVDYKICLKNRDSFKFFIDVLGKTFPPAEVYTNPDDSALVRVQTDTNETLEFFGKKNSDGKLESVTSFMLADTDGDIATVLLNEDALGKRVITSEGAVLDIDYDERTVILTSPDGRLTWTVGFQGGDKSAKTGLQPMTFSSTKTVDKTSQVQRPPSFESNEPRGGILAREHTGGTLTSESFLKDTSLLSSLAGEVVVYVERCGRPVSDAVVTVSGEPVGIVAMPGDSFRMVAVPTDKPGNYVATIPLNPREDLGGNAKELCSGVVTALDAGCTILSQSGLSPEVTCLNSFELGPILGPGAYISCLTGLKALEAYCGSLGQSPTGGSSVMSHICETGVPIAVDRAVEWITNAIGQVSLRSSAIIAGAEPIETYSKIVPTKGPFPTFNIEFDSQLIFRAFADPPSPEAGKPYEVVVEVECMPPDTSLVIDVVRSDGYQEREVCAMESESECVLAVRSASLGDVDEITITVGDYIVDEFIVGFQECGLISGSISVYDAGDLHDNSFFVYLDSVWFGDTDVGESATFPVCLPPRTSHTLTIEAKTCGYIPNDFCTFGIILGGGLIFSDSGLPVRNAHETGEYLAEDSPREIDLGIKTPSQ